MTRLFCQDSIVKKDSTTVIVKVLEVNSANIRYIEFADKKQKKYIVSKNEIIKVIFQNGDILKYHEALEKNYIDSSLILVIKERLSTKPIKQIGDYINFNLTLGAVFNSSDSNRPTDNDTAGKKGAVQYRYSRTENQSYKTGFNAGFNFLLGGSKYIKHIIGVDFLQSNSNFMYIRNAVNPDSTISYRKSITSNFNIKGSNYYLNIVTGIRLTFFETLHIDACVTMCLPALNKSYINGTEVIHETGKSDIERNIKDSISTHSHITTPSLSFNPKISYEFKKNGQKLGVYAAYNLNGYYKLSWFTIGAIYYPFKKLR